MGLFDRFRKKKKPEVSPGGSTIYRYDTPEETGPQPPMQEGVYLEEIEAHFEELFPGRESRVLHELLSDIVHIDVHVMWPTEEQPFYVVYTSGMSDLPMNLPQEISDHEELKYGELYILLPEGWPLSPDSMPPEEAYWPIRMLKFLARFPHQYKTWLGFGHTIPNGPNYTPLDDSVGFGGAVLSWGTGPLGTLKTKDGKEIRFYELIPAYKEEIEYKLKYGMDALLEKFNAAGMNHILDPQRENCCEDFKEILD